MRTLFGSLLLSFLLLTGCGAEHGDDHAHDGGEAHSHDGGEVHVHDRAQAADAPATEAFYADDAADEAARDQSTGTAEPDEAENAREHAHGDGQPHDHDH